MPTKPPALSQEALDRIHREAQEMRDRVMRGESRFEDNKPKVSREPKVPKPKGEPKGPSGRRFNTNQIVEMYDNGEGKTSAQIALELGASRKTVIKHLRDAQVWDPSKESRTGRPFSDFCAEGHDQSKYRAESSPGKGDWHCGLCKKNRNAEYKKKERAKKRDNRVQTQPGGAHMLILNGEEVGLFTSDLFVAQSLHEKLQWLSTPSRAREMRGGR